MSDKPFAFRHFSIEQDRCAMKVGTDSMVLGSWATCPPEGNVLDLGTGTGVLSLMIAQRYPNLIIDAIEIDRSASLQAKENILNSAWADRVTVVPAAVQAWHAGPYDVVISNPPFFGGLFDSPHAGRIKARAGVGLSPTLLIQQISRLLAPEGLLAIVLPIDPRWMSAFENGGLYIHQRLNVKDRPHKEARRMYLLLKKRKPATMVEETRCLKGENGRFSTWYKDLTINFHLPGAIL